MKLSENILNAIHKGLYEALGGDIDLSNVNSHPVIIRNNGLSAVRELHNDILQEELPRPMSITREFIDKAIDWHEKYGCTYNPHFDKRHFKEFIGQCITIYGNDAYNMSLNWIDTSEVTDMSQLFNFVFFNGDISGWNTSNVTNMHGTFENSSFNKDISNWDVSSVKDMSNMFYMNKHFNQPIENWDVSNVTNMSNMFYGSHFNQPIGNWDVRKVTNMDSIFGLDYKFKLDISTWNISGLTQISYNAMKANACIPNEYLPSEKNISVLDEAYKRDDVNTFTPTIKQMREWFVEFNHQFFQDRLPMCTLLVENIGNTTWGVFKMRRTYDRRTRAWISPFDVNTCSITLNSAYQGTLYNLKNTFIHEMVHYWVAFTYNYCPGRSHGPEFLHEAEKINRNSEWNITPTSDNIENELSDEGLEKFKRRIAEEYIIGSLYSDGKCILYRTDEKHMYDASNLCKRFGDNNPKFFKVKIENPNFGVQTTVCRGTSSLTYIIAGKDVNDCFEKLNSKYSITSKEEIKPDFSDKANVITYILIAQDYSDRYWACKADNLKASDKLAHKVGKLTPYKVIGSGNDAWQIQKLSKSSFYPVANALSLDEIKDYLKKKFEIDIEEI